MIQEVKFDLMKFHQYYRMSLCPIVNSQDKLSVFRDHNTITWSQLNSVKTIAKHKPNEPQLTCCRLRDVHLRGLLLLGQQRRHAAQLGEAAAATAAAG